MALFHTNAAILSQSKHQRPIRTISFADKANLLAAVKRNDVHPSWSNVALQTVSSEPNLKLVEIASAFRRLPQQGNRNVSRIIRFKRKWRRTIAVLKGTMSTLGVRGARVAPIAGKVRVRHLELEPLCCLSSCIVRGGCAAVVGFEITYVVITLLMVVLRLYNGGNLKLWSQFEPNFNAFVTHQLFLYVIAAFDMLTILLVLAMSQALIRFNKEFIRLHWYFDFFSLGFNLFATLIYILALSVPGPQSWSLVNTVLVFCFISQIPIQLWAISVVKSCYDFFVLLHVFIAMAET